VYLLVELYVVILNVVFVTARVEEPPVSIPRSVLFIVLNAFQVTLTFALFYRTAFRLDPGQAIAKSFQVFGTVGLPNGSDKGSYLVAFQIALNFVLLAIFLTSIIGQAQLLKKRGGPTRRNRQRIDQATRGQQTRKLMTLWTGIVALFTALLFFATVMNAYFLYTTEIATSRAWLAPVQAEIDRRLSPNGQLNFSIQYGNTGKEPALGFVAQEDIGFIAAPNPTQNLYAVFPQTTLKNVCARTHAVDGAGTIYPSGLHDYTYFVYAAATPAELPDISKIVKGAKAIFIHGCFAYKTFGIERKSEYCFLRLPKIDPETKEMTFKFVRCPYGNDIHEP
jgi:hypothetical protein